MAASYKKLFKMLIDRDMKILDKKIMTFFKFVTLM